MPKKDTSANVLGMLSTAGAQHRPAPVRQDEASPHHTAEVVELPAQHPDPSPAAPEASPSRPQPRREPPTRPAEPPAVEPEAEVNAPRTHRLDQRTANDLRAAWLAARRRGEVTISQQDYAGRIIALGLAAEARQLKQ